MKYATLCSGIGAPETAWKPLGWECVFNSEIEQFVCAVLKHHYPDTPNYGDMTKHKEWINDGTVELICAGTPCQSFSVAGLRKGLDDPRGNLTLVFLGVLDKYRPRWMVYENVAGLLSDKTGAFGAFLGGLAELGYGFAYRILNAQYIRVESHPRAVPQRRRRLFVVGYFGDWRPAAAVLFEPESLHGYPAPCRKTGEEITGTLGSRTNAGGGFGGDFESGGVSKSLKGASNMKHREDSDTLVAGTLQVRKLLPVECERLQGFPDDYTLVEYHGKPAKDGPRYKALGNSMAVNVMSWIGQRIQMVDDILKEAQCNLNQDR